jgi:hypothetical protein
MPAASKPRPSLADVRAALARVEQGRSRLLDLFVAGRLERSEFDRREPPLAREQERLRGEVARLEALVAAGDADAARQTAAVRYCQLVSRNLDRLDVAGRQALLRRLGRPGRRPGRSARRAGALPAVLETGEIDTRRHPVLSDAVAVPIRVVIPLESRA